MDQENKKISFGFTKSAKKNLLFEKPPERNRRIQLIDCLESQKIKIKDACEEVKGPLVIPMVQSVNLLERRREAKKEKGPETSDEKSESELTVEELAARELIREAQNHKVENSGKLFVLPAIADNVIEIEGKAESTLEDYESVPISDYGKAMLRGMGWVEGMGIGKSNKSIKVVEPQLRPKGMGLGASSAKKKEQVKPAVDKDGKELILQKGLFAKIIDGKKKGCYCEVQGFDDEAGRVIVKTSLDGLILNLNEFLLVPVTKEEYLKSSKVINIQKYEQYKDHESVDKSNKHNEASNSSKYYETDNKKHKQKVSSSPERQRSQERHRKHSSSSSEDDQKYRKSSKNRHNTKSSKDYERREKHKSKKKSKKYRSSSSSSVEDGYARKSSKKHSSDDERSYKKDKYKYEKYKTHSNGSDSDSKYNYRKEKHRYEKYSSQKRR